MSPETEYSNLMDEKRRWGEYIATVENEIARHKVEIEVGELHIAEAEAKIAEIDARLDEIRGP